MTDVLIYQGPDGGEVQFENNLIGMDNTPFTAIYLSLFGGNIDDNGTTATAKKQWWGNVDESDLTRHMRSRTQALLIGLPAISSNLQRIEEAAAQDLDWFKQDLANEVNVNASIPARNTVRIVVNITGRNGTPWSFDFTQKWGPVS